MNRSASLTVTVSLLISFSGACGGSSSQGDAGSPEDECTQDIQCNDDNPCTDDSCSSAGVCEWRANSASCDDGNPCTEGDVCANSACVGGENVCPCVETEDCAPFEDGDLCNGTLECSGEHVCALDPATVVTCSSEQDTQCMKNLCEPPTGECSQTAVAPGTECNDEDDCTGGDSCEEGACRGAVELCCDDEVNNDGDAFTDCDDSDCAEDSVCGGECPQLEPVEDSPLPVESDDNAFETTTVNGFTDDYVYNHAGTIKIGTRREWGGTIVFFGLDNGSQGLNSSNTIDSADTGREVQVAFYDVDRWYQNCAWNASCNANPAPTDCPQQMTWLGWNPVQGGNRCNNGSGYEDVSLESGAITVTTNPLYWNPNWDRTDCSSDACGNPAVNQRRSDVEVIQRLRFVREHVVELSYVVTNLGDLDHAVSAHEFPTVYAANSKNGTPELDHLYDSSQQQVAIDQQAPGDDTFRYKNFSSAGGWVTLQNQNHDYGVGLYYENGMGSFQAWQSDDPNFNNFRGLFAFAIPAHGQVRAHSYLILGSLGSVAAEAQWLDQNLPPFGVLDVPADEAEVSGNVTVYGWSLDNKGVAQVQLIVDGGAPQAMSYGTNRPDVCAVWPGYPGCASGNVGYQGSFDASVLTAAECGHVLEVRAVDADGNARIIGRRRVYLAE